MEQLGQIGLELNTFMRTPCLQCCAVCLLCGAPIACHDSLPAQLVIFLHLLVDYTGISCIYSSALSGWMGCSL